MNRQRIFISSVQSEFAEERAMLSHYVRTDVLLGKFFEPFIFEELPAVNQSPEQVYLGEVEHCDLYLGLIGNKYGYEDTEGVSPTEREYDLADKLGKYKLIFINSTTEQTRHPKEAAFVSKIERSVVRKTFSNTDSLRAAVYAALVRYMEEKEIIRWRPFDAAWNEEATINDLDEDKARNFILMARSKRNFALAADTSLSILLQHLNLMDERGRIANAALLLFGKKPQRFFPSSEVKCIQFYGNVVERPAPSYQIYKGDVFELVNQATSFVMSRVNNWVGVRNSMETASVATHPEFPIEAVQEAIVNAVCHRDYTSNASVQVMLFRNRLEVWNPGQLPHELTIEDLYKPHRSSPPNILLAEPMYWNGYIEKVGSGTEDLVERCVNYGLKKPEFVQDANFQVTLWRNVSSEDVAENDRETGGQSGQTGGQTGGQTLELVFNAIVENPKITRQQLSNILKINPSAIQKHIEKLKALNRIQRVGGERFGGHWEIVHTKQ